MPIVMVWDDKLETAFGDGGHTARFQCDACGGLIDDAGKGLVAWSRPPAGSVDDPKPKPIEYFAHKGVCDRTLQQRVEERGRSVLWEELTLFPLHLGNNMNEAARQGTTMVVPTKDHPHYRG